jgi:hypothetical protein
LDVQTRDVAPTARHDWIFPLAVGLILAFAALLRLKGIHDPILDHPGWRQGDTAAIARNFARLQFDVMHPQTLYNGPPPNYVELELQIVPFLAATLYKIFGIHEIFGRLIALTFSVGTVGVVALFARWLVPLDAARGRLRDVAGIVAAFFFAIFPGSIYYGRTFMPDAAMVFFLTAALYAVTRFLAEDDSLGPRALARTTALLAFAYLAKPVAVLGIVPVLGTIWERARAGRPMRVSALAVLVLVPLLILWSYDRRVGSYAEWHWASGITRLHVLPSLRESFVSLSALGDKLAQFRVALGMLRATMLGTISFLLAIAGFVALPWLPLRSRAVLWGWLGGGLLYVYVVVTVERVDYYMAPLLPLCALVIGCAAAYFCQRVLAVDAAPAARYAILAILPILAIAGLVEARTAVAPYYRYNKDAYRNAVFLNQTLDPGALVVVGHYGPDVQYYIDRFGWEEDPALWTPFDEESAIRKGARYFISIEDNRLRANADLCAWLARFPIRNPNAAWPVYETDPARELPNADRFWRAYRKAELAARGRAFLDAHGICRQGMRGSRAIKTS